MSVYDVHVCVQCAEDREREKQSVIARASHTLVIQTMFLSVSISTIQTSPGMFSGGNVLQILSMLLGMYMKLGKQSSIWHARGTFILSGTRLKSLLYYH